MVHFLLAIVPNFDIPVSSEEWEQSDTDNNKSYSAVYDFRYLRGKKKKIK